MPAVAVKAESKAETEDAPQLSREASIQFDIPAQNLASALTAFSMQSHIQVLYEGDIARDLRSAPLKGAYSPAAALQILLGAAPVQAHFTDQRTVTLERRTTEVSASRGEQDAIALGMMTVTARGDYDASDPYNTDYAVPDATTATKTDTPIFDTPVSVQVVPKQVVQDRQAFQLKQTVETVSGVRTNQLSGYADSFVIRGFRQDGVYRNGLLLNFTTLDTANLERIEVLKGPAAVLYGRSEPGGLINVVTKKPLDVPYYALEQKFGSYDLYRTEWDATGPVTDGGSLLYRFAGAYQDSGSFRQFADLERVLLNPSLTWRLSDATDITVELEALLDTKTHVDYFGIPAVGNRPASVPIRRSFQDPNDPDEYFDRVKVGFYLTHRFNESWTLNNRFLGAFHNSRERDLNPAGLEADNRTLNRVAVYYGNDDESYQTNLDLLGKFRLWGTEHQTLIGFDYLRFSRDTPFYFQDYGNPDPALAIDLFDPRYGVDRGVFDKDSLPFRSFYSEEREWYGVYFQDHITLWDKLHILGGGRHDWANVASGASDQSFDAIEFNERKDEKFSPRVGIVYQPWSWLGVYGNWTQSLGANNGRSGTGRPQPPQTGEQFEAGLKTEFFDQSLIATLAFFHITKQNLLTADLSTPQPNDTAPIGEARSKGGELDITGRVTDYLSFTGSYAYTDAQITKDNSGLEGNRLANAALNSGSLWLKYDVNGYAADEGPSFGVGVFAAGQRQGDNENTFQLPGYVRMDAMAAYRLRIGPSRVTAQLNIRNLLDKAYYENADFFSNNVPRLAIWPAQPLTVLGSIRVEF